LIRRNFKDQDIELILGGNFKRVLARIWRREKGAVHDRSSAGCAPAAGPDRARVADGIRAGTGLTSGVGDG